MNERDISVSMMEIFCGLLNFKIAFKNDVLSYTNGQSKPINGFLVKNEFKDSIVVAM